MAKKHDINLLADWAKDWGIKGYEQYDVKMREKHRQQAIKQSLQRERKEQEKKFSSYKKV